MSDSTNSNKETEVGCLGTFVACIVFFIAWFSVATAMPVLGWFLGWIPAAIIAVVSYFATYIALWLVWCIFIFILISAAFVWIVNL